MAKRASDGFSVSLVPIEALTAYEQNARTHDADQVEQIADSIRQFGFTVPLIADLDDGGLIAAGHGRLMAVKLMAEAGEGIRYPNGKLIPEGVVPVIDCASWSDEQRRAYTLADNKIAANSGWDEKLLRVELKFLADEEFDLGVTGFSDTELGKLTVDPSSFGPGTEGDQGQLDKLTPQLCTCPHCGEDFDVRKHKKKGQPKG